MHIASPGRSAGNPNGSPGKRLPLNFKSSLLPGELTEGESMVDSLDTVELELVGGLSSGAPRHLPSVPNG